MYEHSSQQPAPANTDGVERQTEFLADVYANNPTSEDRVVIERRRAEIIQPTDLGGVQLYEGLRESLKDLETDEGWKATREAARAELPSLPPDFLEQVLVEFAPLIKSLPAGHGKGHLLRDTINLLEMLQNPRLETAKVDKVELLVGITAGVFHDIGNSIVERYEDAHRVGAHAEIGAVLFGETARDIVPPNFTRLIQYAIAAHTHYPTKDIPLEDGSTVTKERYTDDTDGNVRESVWSTRKTDRRDTANLLQIVRDMVLRVAPIQDFNGETFDQKTSREQNFWTQFSFSNDSMGLLKHWMLYAGNVYKKGPYTSHDSKYFTEELMTPGVGDLALLLSVVAPGKRDELLASIEENNPKVAQVLKAELDQSADHISNYTSMELNEAVVGTAISNFENICRVIEPAENLDDQLESLKAQFPTLGAEDQQTWARGFMFMTDVLMRRWKQRLVAGVANDPHLGNKITSQDSAVQQQFEELGRHLQAIAQEIVASIETADSTH